jgi:hypothetical protein
MSYRIRKDLRICADWVLSVLCGNSIEDVNPLADDWMRYKFDTFTTRQLMAIEDYSLEELNSAIRLLLRNGHISVSALVNDVPHKGLYATIEGQDAFMGSYYLRENKRDRLESIELYTKWILPIVGAGISLLALALSVYNLIHQNNNIIKLKHND